MTDTDTVNFAHRVTNKLTLIQLGLRLGLARHKLDAILYNNRHSIQEAAFKMILEWLNTQEDRSKAYNNLLTALKHPDVNLHHVAHDVFGGSTVGENS